MASMPLHTSTNTHAHTHIHNLVKFCVRQPDLQPLTLRPLTETTLSMCGCWKGWTYSTAVRVWCRSYSESRNQRVNNVFSQVIFTFQSVIQQIQAREMGRTCLSDPRPCLLCLLLFGLFSMKYTAVFRAHCGRDGH